MKKHMFNSFSFQPIIHQVIKKLHFKEPTKIQQKAIPSIIDGKNLIAESHTGSGKTHAYLIPLLNRLDPSVDQVQIVITLPTRELAQQIYDDIREMTLLAEQESIWRTRLLTGGTDRKQMIERLKTPPHIVVGTPGRILDLILENHLSIYSANAFVIDEADLMYELGLFETIDQLLVRASKNIQQLAFSATIPQPLEHLLKKYMTNAYMIQGSEQLTPEQLEHRLIPLYHREPAEVIFELSKTFHPYLAIIFTNGQDEAIYLAKKLQAYGLNTGLLHGGLSQRERKRTLRQIEQLHYEYVVATDLVSRGIDIEGVSHVINASLPKEIDFYVHRVGRTARAGLAGTAISLFTDEDISLIHKLEQRNVSFIFSDVKNDELIEISRPIAKYQPKGDKKYRRRRRNRRQ